MKKLVDELDFKMKNKYIDSDDQISEDLNKRKESNDLTDKNKQNKASDKSLDSVVDVSYNYSFLLLNQSKNYFVFLNYPDYTQCIKKTEDLNLFSIYTKDRKSDFNIYFKAYKNVPDCITKPLENAGVVRTTSFLKANLIWKLLKPDKMFTLIKKLNSSQRYNHFPCTWQIGRKDNLWRNFSIFQKEFGKNHFSYVPDTFILPEDETAFKENILPLIKNNKADKMYILKPVASSRGRGIKLLTPTSSIPNKCIISSYISNPHIINNKKYDLRIYVFISSFNPLKIYLYREGLVRFASEDYDSNNLFNKFIYLTNYSINKENEHFDANVSSLDQCTGSKWSLSALRSYFEKEKLDFSIIWNKIKDIIIKTSITIEKVTTDKVNSLLDENNNNLFELYGFDILIDSNLDAWLMEVNLNPSLNTDTALDLKIKSMLMTDIFNTIGLESYNHSNKNLEFIHQSPNYSLRQVKKDVKDAIKKPQIEGKFNILTI